MYFRSKFQMSHWAYRSHPELVEGWSRTLTGEEMKDYFVYIVKCFRQAQCDTESLVW